MRWLCAIIEHQPLSDLQELKAPYHLKDFVVLAYEEL
jgi:hypothetical protein